MAKWKSMDSAPKDGTLILLYAKPNDDYSTASWQNGFWDMLHGSWEDQVEDYQREFFNPTHWKKLKPPKG